jgi:PPP family 3-phenylpropionic acid transporter
MAIYINKEMPAEWKASGQTLYGLISLVGARIIGSLLGGFVSGIIGVKLIFLYNSILSLAAVIVFGLCVYEWKRIRIFRSSP